VKHINTRFLDDLYAEIAAAADAEERPVGSWLRIAAKEKLGRLMPAISTSSTAVNTGHGWVRSRPDGYKARCGGPAICSQCALEAARSGHTTEREVSPNFKKGGKN
jgi:hypothetical protein